MLHSIIVPCRNRHESLELCLASLDHSAGACNAGAWEIVIIDDSLGFQSMSPRPNQQHFKVSREDCYFNKPRLLNEGMDRARGDVLTFLDADAVVAPKFMENAQRLRDNPGLTKLCYRVRHLSNKDVADMRGDIGGALQNLFARYDLYKVRREFYGRPDRGSWQRPHNPVFGNSQFSIRREVLGGLRFDERFKGRGYEDIHFNFLLWKHCYGTYKAEMVVDAQHAMFHLENPPTVDEDWGPTGQNNVNYRLYKKEFRQWVREMKHKGIVVYEKHKKGRKR